MRWAGHVAHVRDRRGAFSGFIGEDLREGTPWKA